MKIRHLLISLVSISLTVISTRAATSENNDACIQLPAYTVEAPRQTAAEKQIAKNLDELRAAARTPLTVQPEIPLLKAISETGHEASTPAPVLVVAKS